MGSTVALVASTSEESVGLHAVEVVCEGGASNPNAISHLLLLDDARRNT
jgi:hypothetical protein